MNATTTLLPAEQTVRRPDKRASGHILGVILFLMFVAPSRLLATFPVGNVQTNLFEAGSIAIIALYIVPHAAFPGRRFVSNGCRTGLIMFLVGVILSAMVHSAHLLDFVRINVRLILPFIAAAVLTVLGIKDNQRVLLRWVCLGIITSFLISLVIYATGYEHRFRLEETRTSLTPLTQQGRFDNQNAPFGVVGLMLILDPLRCRFAKGTIDRALVYLASALSILFCALVFNRTYLIVMSIEVLLIQLYISRVRVSVVFKSGLVVAAIIGVMIYAYETDRKIRRQIEKRLLIATKGTTKVVDAVYYQGGREALWKATFRGLEDDWTFGMPPNEPMLRFVQYGRSRAIFVPDNALFATWIRLGFICTIGFAVFWGAYFLSMQRMTKSAARTPYEINYAKGTVVVLFVYFVASLNMNSILNHNSVYFATLLPFFWWPNNSRTVART